MGTAFAVASMLGVACSGDPEPAPLERSCAMESLQTCVASYSAAIATCYTDSDGPCASDDAGLAAALDTLGSDLDGCTVGELDAEATRGRLQNACASEASSLAARTFGGPQGAVWADVGQTNRTCLTLAHEAATTLIEGSLEAMTDCQAEQDCSGIGDARESLAATARTTVQNGCRGFAVSELITMDTAEYVDRAAHQVDCMAAMAGLGGEELGLQCGPDHAQFDAPRGEWMQVTVDSEEWGTMCGDGSPYAFYVRLAPEGADLDQVVIGLQGGGVCLFEEDCGARLVDSPDLFSAAEDLPPETGIMSNDPSNSAFAEWTKVYLPYCNQDVFAGGGVEEKLGAISIPRYGSLNVRAAVQMVRDVIWQQMDAAGGPGFRPDEVVALFGGWSAGGIGTLYNYHWMLDDLQWPRTAAFPDAGLALDNGSVLGVAGIGLLKIPAWGTIPYLPPYCFDGDCAVGPVLYEATAPRLRAVPEQQMLIVSNPNDDVQQQTTFFGPDTAGFINEVRTSYCETKDLNGIQYYFTSIASESVHVVSLVPELWTGQVDGVAMRDWFERAITDPDTVTDRAEESDFVKVVEGVEPYPCDVAP
ncbi:MAG: pectin acetylesterase-family hydrolase [Myxococcota bacterium]